GDYAGYAQEALENAYPGAIALFMEGCGGDANPLPRYQGDNPKLSHYSVELASIYGKILAAAVDLVLHDNMRPVVGPIRVALDHGDSLTLVALTGEPVIDYSLRFKAQYGWDNTWVAGYNNELLAYIPSLRVLKEGSYEGADAMYE